MGIGLCGRGPWRTLRAILSVSAIAVPKAGNKIHCELRLSVNALSEQTTNIMYFLLTRRFLPRNSSIS